MGIQLSIQLQIGGPLAALIKYSDANIRHTIAIDLNLQYLYIFLACNILAFRFFHTESELFFW